MDASPYINHPIEVAEILARVGGVSDVITLQAAILHDTLEDTETTPEEIDAAFGARCGRWWKK
ncbi:HD domain-containing protein [Thermoleptolyngbya sp.]